LGINNCAYNYISFKMDMRLSFKLTSIVIEWIEEKKYDLLQEPIVLLAFPMSLLQVASEWFMEDLGSYVGAYDTICNLNIHK